MTRGSQPPKVGSRIKLKTTQLAVHLPQHEARACLHEDLPRVCADLFRPTMSAGGNKTRRDRAKAAAAAQDVLAQEVTARKDHTKG